jgi:hypothetical protein
VKGCEYLYNSPATVGEVVGEAVATVAEDTDLDSINGRIRCAFDMRSVPKLFVWFFGADGDSNDFP